MDNLDFSHLGKAELERMAVAGEEVVDCIRVLAKSGDNIVGELLRHEGEFLQWDHYPPGDVYDRDSASQYYYHSHPPEERPGEHGHFHTFIRPKGMPDDIKPAMVPDFEAPEDANDALSHLIAISMNNYGLPISLFTTNRWVTGEIWYTASDVTRLLDCFEIDLVNPGTWPVNCWLTGMVQLFRPQIADLVRQRDAAVAAWTPKDPKKSVYEDRTLEITSKTAVSIDAQVHAVTAALKTK
ncbi:MAG: hypothetical protein GY791_08900 [Alphaproteobacteria bacterium]|nr:hypothetical protein [Alphaproteobacteria bacterium]